MGRKRTRAGRVAEIAKAAVLQGLLPLLGIWFTVAFRETITIGRKRLGICRHHRPPPGSKPKLTGQAAGLGRPARFALMDRQTQRSPGLVPWLIRTWFWEKDLNLAPHRALSAPAGNEGVGEHVRTRFQPGLRPGEIANHKIRTERRKPVSSAGPVSRSELPKVTIQPFDLMSRRHPLSSTRACFQNPLREANYPEGSCDVPASSRRQFFRSEITSSSWRPCGSSSQSSSLRSSPSLPS
jgi:hypothetical protein